MIADLKPYSKYKDSGLPWVGQIPAHWDCERAKWLFTQMNRPVREEDEVVTCFRDGMVTLRKNRRLRGFTEASVFSGYQGIRKGDLVIHGMDAFAGAIGVSDSDGKSTPVYNVCRPKMGVNAHFYAHVLREMSQSQWILALAKGIRERSTDFRFEMFGYQRVPFPPEDEQLAIVRFLDWVNSRLERTIRAKRKVIALLNEQKQAIIHRAVTRGLDPAVPMKDSGMQWIARIPVHWDVRPVKQLLSRMDYGTSESSRDDGKIPVLTMGNIKDGMVSPPGKGGVNVIPESLLLEANDLLFNRTNSPELVGKVGLFTGELEDAISFASYLVRLRVKAENSPAWLNYVLNSVHFWAYARSQALVSLHQANLNSTRYGQMLLPVPPWLEQVEMAKHIRAEADSIGVAISRLEREIELIREYRTRLFADVVTGKLDVRVAAEKLSESPADDEKYPVNEDVDIFHNAEDVEFEDN